MLESVLFRRQSNLPGEAPIDCGSLVEAMLFYGKTNIVVDQSTLGHLLRHLGIDTIIELLSEGMLSMSYTEQINGIRTETEPTGRQLHDPVIFSSPQHAFPDELRKICINLTGKDGKGRRTARRIEPLVNIVKIDNMVSNGARASILDNSYLKTSVTHLLAELVPGTSLDNFEFAAEQLQDRLYIHTNLNFPALNHVYNQRIPVSHSSLSSAYLLNHIFDAECDLYFSSMYNSELVTRPLNTKLLSHRINYLIQKRIKNEGNLSRFQSVVFSNASAIGAAIRAGDVKISDLLPVLRRSLKFKEWLASKPYDADLLGEYYKAITHESLIDKIPGKSARFAIFSGAGIAADTILTGGIGTLAGISLGVLDTFVMDRLLKGWQPNQFIEDDLRPLLQQK